MKITFKTAIASMALALTILTPAIGADIPRLFAAEKGQHLLFLLPVTHISTPVENSPTYLNDVIRQAFRQSTILYDESSLPAGSESLFLGCHEEFEDKALDEELHDVFLKAVEGSTFWEPNRQIIGFVNRFTKFTHILRPHERIGPFRADMTMRSSVHKSLYLAHRIPAQSIETTDEVFRTFCAIDIEKRKSSIRTVLAELGPKITSSEPSLSVESVLRDTERVYFEELRRAIAELHDLTGRVPDSTERGTAFNDAFDTLMITPRNRLWASKINQLVNTTAVPFYALGVLHFPTQKSGKGLIALLREGGYSLTLVTNRKELNKILRRHHQKNAIPE